MVLDAPQSGDLPALTAPVPTMGNAPSDCIMPTMSSSPQPSATWPLTTRSMPIDVTSTHLPLAGIP